MIGSFKTGPRQFRPANIAEMQQGRAPFARLTQQTGAAPSQMRYNLHHLKAIANGGPLYDLDNIVVLTPRFHSMYTYGR